MTIEWSEGAFKGKNQLGRIAYLRFKKKHYLCRAKGS